MTLSVQRNSTDIPGTAVEQYITNAQNQVISGNTIVSLNADDVITLAATAGSGTPTATFETVSLNVRKLDA